KDDEVRLAAVDALGEIGPGASDAVPLLIETCRDPNSFLRRGAATALGDIGPDAKSAAALGELLKDKELDVRQAAAEALQRFGPDAKPATEPLLTALQDVSP